MKTPHWALRRAQNNDRDLAKKAISLLHAQLEFRDPKELRRWMSSKGWRSAWFFPEESFRKQVLENDSNFDTAITEEVVNIWIPKDHYTISVKELNAIDALHAEKDWDHTVMRLRDIRYAIDAGVLVEINGQKFDDARNFYNLAHERYRLLEECSTLWILGDW